MLEGSDRDKSERSARTMNHPLLLASLDKLLPLAAKWVAAVEQRIEREGLPLLDEELEDARAVGVIGAERVRLLPLARARAGCAGFAGRCASDSLPNSGDARAGPALRDICAK